MIVMPTAWQDINDLEVDGIVSRNTGVHATNGVRNEHFEWERTVHQFGNVPYVATRRWWVCHLTGDPILPMLREIFFTLGAEMRPAPEGTPPRRIQA